MVWQEEQEEGNNNNMAMHGETGLGDFVLMENINMDEFVNNLKIR